MGKYLGSEGVSVSSLAVHRYSDDAKLASASMPDGQLNANTQGHRSGEDERRGGGGAQKNQSEAVDQPSAQSTSAINSLAPGSNVDDNKIPSACTRGFSYSAPGFLSPLGTTEGGSGSWLNVSA
jgi:hypothetical protein